MPSSVLSLRVSSRQSERLKRKASRIGRSASETGALLLEEALRRDEFAFIDFRDSPLGRQACLQGARLSVWMIVKIFRSQGKSVEKTALYLGRSPVQIQAALNYAEAFPEEIENAIADNDSYDVLKLSRMVPQTRIFTFKGQDKRDKRSK
jgi:uncharacterized protein (DUF433 family)